MANSKMVVIGLGIALLLGLLTGIILAASEDRSQEEYDRMYPPQRDIVKECAINGVIDITKCLER